MLIETWLLPKDEHPLFSTFNTLRRDRYESNGGKSTTRGGGLLTYIHSDLYLITERHVSNVDIIHVNLPAGAFFLPILRVPPVNFQNLPPVIKILTYILRSIFLEIPHLELPC